MAVDLGKLCGQLILEEGLRLKAYYDNAKPPNLTVAVGRNLDANPLSQNELRIVGHDARTQPITRDNAMMLLDHDITKATHALDLKFPWWSTIDEVRSRVMADLTFNMGIFKLMEFHHFLGNMQKMAFYLAADDLKDSAWYNQVGKRGPRLVNMVRTGEDYSA